MTDTEISLKGSPFLTENVTLKRILQIKKYFPGSKSRKSGAYSARHVLSCSGDVVYNIWQTN